MKKSKIIVVAVVLVALLVVINSNNNVFGYSWSGENSSSTGGGGGGAGGCKSPRDYYTPTIACGVSWIYYKYSGTPYAQSNSNDPGPMFKFQPHRNNSNFTIPSACSVTGGFWHLGSTIKFNSDRWGTTNSLTPEKSESNLWEYENNKYGHADTWTWKVSTWSDYNLDSGSEWTDNLLGHKVKVPGLSGSFNAAYFGTYDSVWESYKENIDGSASGIPTSVYAFCASDPKKPDVNNVDTSSRMRVTGPKLDTGWHESGRDSITKNRNVVRVVHGDKATVETKHKGFRSAETSSDKVNFEASIATIIKQGENLDTTVTKKGDGSDFGSTWTFAANATEKEWAATNSRGLSFEPDSSAWACEGIVHKEKVDSKGKTSGDYEKSGYCEFIYRPQANFTGKITATVVAKNASGATLDTKTKSTDEGNGGSIAITLPENSGKYSVNFTQSVTRKDLSSYGSAGGTMKAEIKSYTKRTDFFRKENNVTIDLTEGQTQQTFGNDNTKNVRTLGYSSDNQYGGISGELYYGESVKYCSHLNTVSWLKKRSPVDYDNKYICVTISRPSKKCSVKTKEKVNIQEYGVNAGRNYGSIGVKNFSNGQSESTTITSADGAVGPVLGNVFAKPGDSIQFEYNMCAGAFYTAQANDLGSRNNTDYGSRYGAEGQLEHGALGTFKTNGQDGYLFKKSLPMVDSVYHNPARYVQIGGRDWRWSDGQKAESPMKSGKFMTNTTAHPWFASAEDTETSPDINDTTYECTHQKTNNNNTSAKKEANAYQVSGKQSTGSGSSKCHTSIGNIFDVGGTISQSMYWNNLRLDVTGTSRTVKAFGANQDAVATAYVKVPYNYILKPYVKNENGKDKNTRVVYLGETYKMTPGVMTAPRENYRVTFNDNKYATITKETHVKLKTYYIHNGWEYPAGGNAGNAEDIVMRFNRDGYLGEANDVVKTIEFTVPDSDNAANNAPSVGDKICTDITVWPADSHDHPDAVYNKANTSNTPNNSSVYKNAGGERGTAQNPYLTIALREDSVRGKENSRTTTSCSMIAKRPTMSVESGNAYSKKGYNMSRYTKNIGGRNYNFSSWSEYGVFGRINKVDEHLISGAAVGYNMDTFYGKENRDKNKARANTNNGSSDANISMNGYSTNTCLFETQTFANADCNAKNEIDIGGQSVTDYKQKILDRYKADGNNVECDGDIEYEEYEYRDGKRVKTIKKYCKVQNLGEGNGLMKYTKNNGSSAIVVKADKNIYIENENGSIPANIPKYFTDEKADEGEDNQIDFNRTLVYDASGQDIVIDGDIAYNENEKSNLDDIVGVVIIAKNVYFTNKPTHIDAVIIAEEEVNTCKYANGIEMMIDDGATLNSDVCNQSLIFEAPVITKKLVLNRTAGADNGIESIKRAEIFNLNMANYLWSFNQMSRYSQAVTTYSRELPSRY